MGESSAEIIQLPREMTSGQQQLSESLLNGQQQLSETLEKG